MIERSIRFNHIMVQAILDGRKTQTRRVIKLPPAPMHLGIWEATTFGGAGCFRIVNGLRDYNVPEIAGIWHTRTGKGLACPYGDVAARLWVHRYTRTLTDPRLESRLTLEITGVRAERLQDCTEEDAKAEGVEWQGGNPDENGLATQLIVTAKDSFRHLWDDIYARDNDRRWSQNPWVWVIEFKRLAA